MGFVGGLIGTAGGANGTGFGGPVLAGIQTPATSAQADEQYKNVQDAIQQQKDFLAAVQAQNGLSNQSNVFNQFGDIAAGKGPNPAIAALNQATGQATQQQAATQASQRGSSANAGLIARQAAQQGSANKMTAAGQAATLQANQSLNALTSMANIAGQQVGNQANATGALSNSVQNEQSNILNAITGQNNSNISRQSNVNNNNAALAGINMQGQQNLLGGLMNSGGGMMSSFGLAEGGEVEDQSEDIKPEVEPVASGAPEEGEDVKTGSGVSSGGGAQIGSTNIPTIGNAFAQSGGGGGGGGGGLSSMIGLLAMAKGGRVMVPRYANGGVSEGPAASIGSTSIPTIKNGFAQTPQQAQQQQQAGSDFGNFLKSSYNHLTTSDGSASSVSGPGPQRAVAPSFAHGGKVKAMVSPGEVFLPPKAVKQVAKGKDPIQAGKKVPGKPKYPGNDYRNDVVPAKLDEGGIVIPNKILQSPNPHWEAMRFVHATLKKSKNRGQK